jgi:NhaP-type Na+/H+ or K+/H+ antiporter
VILGAVLAPTDPVLASDVQVADAQDTDHVRFTLTAEAGLNDGTAFPFVMLGLGLLGLHDLGELAWRWWVIDVAWKIMGGLVIGAVLGAALARFVVYIRREHREATGMDDFLAMGLIALAYGCAHVCNAYGFLAVFASGLALRVVERQLSPDDAPPDVRAVALAESEEDATHPEKAPAYMAEAVLHFNEHLERIGELMLVLIVGALLAAQRFSIDGIVVAGVLLFLIRPLSTYPATFAGRLGARQSALIAWFGVRGIGSVYYLFYAISHGLDATVAQRLLTIMTWVIAISVGLHGVSVTPLMSWYERTLVRKPKYHH